MLKVGPQDSSALPSLARVPAVQNPALNPRSENQSLDGVSMSQEAEAGEDGEVPNLGALRETLGQRELQNPSAEMQQDCVSILSMLGKPIPEGVDTRKTLLASPIGKGDGVLQLDRVTSVAKSDRGHELLDQLMRSSATARAQYGGKLPPKVEQLFQTTLAALREVGVEPGKAPEGEPDKKEAAPGAAPKAA